MRNTYHVIYRTLQLDYRYSPFGDFKSPGVLFNNGDEQHRRMDD